MSPNDRMTARGSSPTHEGTRQARRCPFCGAEGGKVDPDIIAGFWVIECQGCNARGPNAETGMGALIAWNTAFDRYDLPSLRREAAAQALEEAAKAFKLDPPFDTPAWLRLRAAETRASLLEGKDG